MSLFDLTEQNSNLDFKIVAGLERLSQVFRILLWEKAKEYSLSPIQIQLLIFIHHHSSEKSTISYLSKEFNLTKPTISDAIKVLEEKKLIKKFTDNTDTRSYTIQLTALGKRIAADVENYADPFSDILKQCTPEDKLTLWENITHMIVKLNQREIISIQRTCFNCIHYTIKGEIHFCNLLVQALPSENIRIDCPEFEVI